MIVGTAGHIDHGKTSLVRALTGVDTDRLKEEKARGISIELGFAYLPAPDGSVVGFIDVPGHEKLVHTMLAGASGIDLSLLVVAADDGLMPQTREHLAILDLLGVSRGLVALTKCDLVSAERQAEVANEIANELATTALADCEIVPVSVVSGAGVDALREKLFAVAKGLERRSAEGRFRLAVDRSFTLHGTGTVVTGTVLSGRIAVGDTIVVSPKGLRARVRSIHAQNRLANQGFAGDRCALNLAGDSISKEALRRGDVVCDPALHVPTERVDVRVRFLASGLKPVVSWTPFRFHHASVEVGARLVLLGDAPIRPGDEALAQLVLEQPITAAAGDRFVLRDTTGQRTLGGGALLDLRPPTRKRRTPERLAQLDAMAEANPEIALARLLALTPHHLDLAAFARDRALSVPQIEPVAEKLGLIRKSVGASDIALLPARWLKFKRDLLAALDLFHADNPDLPGIGLERLRLTSQPRLAVPAFRAFLLDLVRSGDIAMDGAWVRRAAHSVKLSTQDEAAWRRIAPLISADERFRPPRVRDLAHALDQPEADVRRLMKQLGRMGRLDEVAQDHFFLRTTTSEMVEIMTDIAASVDSGLFTAAQLRDRLDNGRKVAIQILEFFDRHGVTLRRGDLRRLNPHRLDLFQAAATLGNGRESSPVGRPDFKSGRGREPVPGGFDTLSLPPTLRARSAL